MAVQRGPVRARRRYPPGRCCACCLSFVLVTQGVCAIIVLACVIELLGSTLNALFRLDAKAWGHPTYTVVIHTLDTRGSFWYIPSFTSQLARILPLHNLDAHASLWRR